MRYLCEGAPGHVVISDAVNMSKKLGIKIFVSSKTPQESQHFVNLANEFYARLENSQIGTALLSSSVEVNNPIIDAFVAKGKNNAELKWSGNISRFKDLEVLLLTEDIEVSDDGLEDITKDELYPRVRQAVIDAKEEHASPEVIEHDSYNLVLVQKLRNKYPTSMIGSSVWLLTIDNKLPRVDRIPRSTYPEPHCRTVGE